MEKKNQVQTVNNQVAPNNEPNAAETFRLMLQNFTTKLNKQPPPESIGKTPDGKASTITISHIEMTLDEYFFGLWETENFKWAVIANEIVGSLDLVITHPVTNQKYKRVGAGAIQIMVDAAPQDIKDDRQQKNRWALDPGNKKSNALDMGFPKLKAECLKNAAQSFGKLFGRDLNRKVQDNYQPLIKTQWQQPKPELNGNATENA